MEFNLFELLTYFIIYSFLGWVMESTVRSISEKKLINTGFLIGPFCPIYGIGAIIMFLFLNGFENKTILLFFIAIIVLTAWEYIVGVLLEKIFKTKYWDYSDQKFNLQGRICLANSICWGILGVIFVKYLHPFIQGNITKIDINILKFSITIVSVVMITDFIVSVIKIKNINATLEKIEEINKEIKEKLKEIKLQNKEQNRLIAGENIQKLVEELKNKRDKTIMNLYKNINRLKKAFPAIDTKEIREILNKKLEIKKEIEKLKNIKNIDKDLK